MKTTYKTKAREEIVAYLKAHAEQRFTARTIYEAVCKRDAGINRTTVYRNLDRLCETGELLKYKESNQNAWYYQYSSEHDHCDEHMHAQCSECGKIFHLDEPYAKAFGDKLLEVCGLRIEPSKSTTSRRTRSFLTIRDLSRCVLILWKDQRSTQGRRRILWLEYTR